MAGRDWYHAGISEVKLYDDTYLVQIPDDVFDPEKDHPPIIKEGRPIFWSYEIVSGIIVISNQELEDRAYEYETDTKFGGDSSHRSTIPKRFIEPHAGPGNPAVDQGQAVPEDVRIDPDGRLHFMYHEGMVEDRIRSCYVLTDEKFNDRFNDSELWDGQLDQVPRFG